MQIVIWFIIPPKNAQTDNTNNALALIVLLQYVPRLYLIFPLSLQIIKATGVVTKTAWAGAAYNLLLYMLASHVSWVLSLSLSQVSGKDATRPSNSLRGLIYNIFFAFAGFRGSMVFAIN